MTMTKPIPSVFVAAALAFTADSAAQQTQLQPGMWRVQVESTTNGKAEPPQDNQTCLKDELKDPARYFAPELEGVKAKCTRTRVPNKDKNVLGYRLKCAGSNFTTEADAQVIVVTPEHFRLALRMESKTPTQQALVIARGEAKRVGNCP